MLEITVNVNLLHTMFSTGIRSLTFPEPEKRTVIAKIYPNPQQPPPQQSATSASKSTAAATGKKDDAAGEPAIDEEINLSCYILMLDVLYKQLEWQEINSHKGLDTKEAQQVLILIRDTLRAPWIGSHTCGDISAADVAEGEVIKCAYCEMCAIWYQLALLLIEYFCPVMEVTMPDLPTETVMARPLSTSDGAKAKHAPPLSRDSSKEAGSTKQSSLTRDESLSSQQPPPQTSQASTSSNVIRTAIVSEFDEHGDFAAPVSIETVTPVVARAATITEEDVAGAVCTVASAQLVDENDQVISSPAHDTADSAFWQTSLGNFKFTIEELPVQLQITYMLLKELESHHDADVLYHLLYCLKIMSLHAEVLNKSAKNHRGFLIWCQENLLIPNLWTLLQAEFSQISQLGVPLLMHCITLPAGVDKFWRLVEDDFHNENWRARFAAVERVTTIAHFVEPAVVKNSPLLQSSLANAFSYLVHCLDDVNAAVAQRAHLNLELIKTASLKLLVWCLEVQFDLVIVDRPMILATIFQLYNHLSERRFLTWDFFLNRFDALLMESQLNLERLGEISYKRDLKNSNVNSETYQRKVTVRHGTTGASAGTSTSTRLIGEAIDPGDNERKQILLNAMLSYCQGTHQN